MTKPTIEQIHDLAAHLCGACGGPSPELLEECGIDPNFDDMELNVMIEAEGEIFLCNGCGWWFENSEQQECDDGPKCADCAEEE